MKTIQEIFQELDADPANAILSRVRDGVVIEMTASERQSHLEEQARSLFERSAVGWSSARLFMDTFTPEEKALISLSTDPIVASLRLDIATWPDRVLLEDARVQLGLSRLVDTNIISSERRLEIEGTAS